MADHDREPSLPRLVREADRRWRRRAASDHAARVRERLAERYAAEVDLRTRLGLPAPPSGRPRRPRPTRRARSGAAASPTTRTCSLEWAWDVNADLDPARLAAGSHERVAWRCLLEPGPRVGDAGRRPHLPRLGLPLPHGHPGPPRRVARRLLPVAGPRVASRPRNALRPDQVSRASAREVVWRCEQGHEWSAAVYQRTLSGSGCPDCYRARGGGPLPGRQGARPPARDAAELAKVIALRVVGCRAARQADSVGHPPRPRDSHRDKTGCGAPGGLWARTNNTTGVAARERPCSCAPPHATSIPGPLDLLPVAPSRRRSTRRRRGAVPAGEPDLALPAALARTRHPGSGTRVVRPRAQGSRTWATISISIPPIPRAVTWTVVRGGTPVAPTRRT